jgi:hypothetical protein
MRYLTGAEKIDSKSTAPLATRWGWPEYLALIGVPILGLNVWTMVLWLLDGPHMVTAFRAGHTLDWYAARVFEGIVIAISVWVIYRLVQGCRRERKFLTFDVMFCLVAATQTWADIAMHFFQPMFAASSNWVNLNNPCGNIPLVVNPDCGRAPDPILFLWLLETFVVIACAWGLGVYIRRLRRRHPDWSNAKLIVIVIVCGCGIALFEPLLMIPLHLWSYPGFRWSFTINGGRYAPFPELIGLGLYFGLLCSLHIFRDDRGNRLVERGLERYSPKVRVAITLLAMYTVFQIVMWVFGNGQLWPQAFHQKPWDNIPAYLNNGLCNTPSVPKTRYGPCPGSAGYRIPVNESDLTDVTP